jgi:hypothetical protein
VKADVRVLIAGCYTLEPSSIAMHVLLGEEGAEGWGGLSRLPLGASVLLRRPLRGSPGPVEAIVADLCATLNIDVEWRSPVAGRGGLGTIERDEDMVRDSDAVVTYLDQARVDEGGTHRIQRMGMHMNKPSWSFAPVQSGPVTYVGASESTPTWTSA